MSALPSIPEQEGAAVAQVEAATSLVERIALGLEVTDEASYGQAEQLALRVKAELRSHETARVELVKPLNDHVRTINARFREAMAPAERARRVIGNKIVAYRAEMERKRQEAEAVERRRQAEQQRRLDDERRAAEAMARAERAAAAREAARKEAEAREAERRRREQMEREAGELAQQVETLGDEALHQIVVGGREAERAAAAAELRARFATRKANEEAAAARQREEDARLAEEVAKAAPRAVALPAPLPVAAPAPSAVASRKVWRATVVDPSRVPRAYLVVDQRAINAAMRAGVRDIPGVDIRQHGELALRGAS